MRRLSRRLRPETVYLILEACTSLFFAMAFTISAVYRVQTVGLDALQLVLLGTALEVSYFVFQIPTGIIADTYSRRLSTVFGMVLIGLGIGIEGIVPRFAVSLLSQLVWGAGAAFTSGATEAWIAGEIGEAKTGPLFIRGTQIGLVFSILGTISGALLANFGLTVPILLSGVCLTGLGIFLGLTMTENGFQPTPRGDQSRFQSMTGTLRKGMREIRVKPLLLTIMVITVLYGAFTEGFDRLWQAHMLTNFTFPSLGSFNSVVWFGIIGVSVQLLSLGATELVRRRVDTKDPTATARALRLGYGLLVINVIVFGLAGNFLVALVTYWLVALVRTTLGPLFNAWLVQNTEPQTRATVLSMNSQANAIGQIAGGPVIGAIAKAFSLRIVMVLAGAILAPTVIIIRRAAQGERTDIADPVESKAL